MQEQKYQKVSQNHEEIEIFCMKNAAFSLMFKQFLIFDQGNDVGETTAATGDLLLPTHQAVHRELEPYTELMQLLRALDNKAFQQLTKVYTGTMSKLYQRDLKLFFEEAKSRLISTRPHGIHSLERKYF